MINKHLRCGQSRLRCAVGEIYVTDHRAGIHKKECKIYYYFSTDCMLQWALAILGYRKHYYISST